MKQFSFTLKRSGKAVLLAALFVGAMGLSSCKKEGMGKMTPSSTPAAEKSMAMRNAVVKVLKDFTASTAGGSSTTTTGSGTSTWASGISVTTYSTPSANVYQWSDPTTGTIFTFSESTGGGGGLGQLAYSGKSFDYNYVLSIKASDNDPTWSGFFNGRDLRGVVAIDGELTDTDFTLRNLALFFVATTGGSGSYKFIDFGASTYETSDALGEIVDLSEGPPTALSALGTNGKVYITAGGHVTVSDNSFEMESDAKIMDVTTSVETSLEGMLMFE